LNRQALQNLVSNNPAQSPGFNTALTSANSTLANVVAGLQNGTMSYNSALAAVQSLTANL